MNSENKPKFSLDQPTPKIKANLPQDHQDMWKNVINHFGKKYPTIINLLNERRQYGIDIYGTPLQLSNGRNAIADLISEHLDALVYAEIIRIEKPVLETYIRYHQKYLLEVIVLFTDLLHEEINISKKI